MGEQSTIHRPDYFSSSWNVIAQNNKAIQYKANRLLNAIEERELDGF
jgi:hypothetical protein